MESVKFEYSDNTDFEPEVAFQTSKKRSRALFTSPKSVQDAKNSDTKDCIEVDTSQPFRSPPMLPGQTPAKNVNRRLAAEVSSDEDNNDSNDEGRRPIKRKKVFSINIPRKPTETAEFSDDNSVRSEIQVKHGVSGALFSQFRHTPPKQRTTFRRRIASPVAPLRHFVEISDDEEDVQAFDLSDSGDETPTPQERTAKKGSPVGGFGFGNLDDSVLRHRLETKATPLIRALAGNLFGKNLAPVEFDELDRPEYLDKITCDPVKLRRLFNEAVEGSTSTEKTAFDGRQTWYDSKTDREGYGAAIIDNVGYQPRDCVLIRTFVNSDGTLSSQKSRNSELFDDTVPERSFKFRFARISYFFEEFGTKYAHIRWFKHGTEISDLGEFAAPHALFLVTACQDMEISSIAGKIKVDFIGKEAAPEIVESRLFGKNHFYYQFHCQNDEAVHKITDATIHKHNPEKQSPNFCDCCAEKEKLRHFEDTLPIGNVGPDGSVHAFLQKGIEYCLLDFVYIAPAKGKPSDIGQITGIQVAKYRKYLKSKAKDRHCNLEISIRMFYRVDELHNHLGIEPYSRDGIRDGRMVYIAHEEIVIDSDDLEDKCQIRHSSTIEDIERYKDKEDTFHVKEQIRPTLGLRSFEIKDFQPHELQSSHETERELSKLEEAKAKFFTGGRKLRALEVFAGVGGLSLGLDLSGAVETKWMIEFAPTTAKTAKQNHPGVKVFNEDLSICLKRLVEQEGGIKEHFYKDNNGARVMPMPRVGEVDIIVAGFPCPGYSGVNHHKLADDVKNTLILPLLSSIELYRPKYVLLENVKGLISHKLGATQAGQGRIEGGIPMGIIKFVHRTLTLLGYQVQYTVVQAGEYGTPQSRQRVIIWGALQGYELPAFPQPTTVFSGRSSEKHSWHKIRRSAPHAGMNVGDAIDDLAKWDWINPHKVMPQSNEENANRLERALTVQQFRVLQGQAYVGLDEQDYASHPLNEFQRKLRRNIPKNMLSNHVTLGHFDNPSWNNKNKGISRATTEQVCSVAMHPGADYKTLPEVLQPWSLSGKDNTGAKKIPHQGMGKFGRVKRDQPYKMCVTQPSPNSKGGPFIHYNQHRTISIREFARAQGFPDWFKWELRSRLHTRLAYRMIGNAVPIPLGEALGRELLKVEVSRFEKEQKCSSQAKGRSGYGSANEDEKQLLIAFRDKIKRSRMNLDKNLASAPKSVNEWTNKKGKSVEDAIELDEEWIDAMDLTEE